MAIFLLFVLKIRKYCFKRTVRYSNTKVALLSIQTLRQDFRIPNRQVPKEIKYMIRRLYLKQIDISELIRYGL